jgi:hypothetical protein
VAASGEEKDETATLTSERKRERARELESSLKKMVRRPAAAGILSWSTALC